MAVTRPASTFCQPTNTTLAALTIASAVSTMPSASPTSALGATANSLSELRFIARTSSLRASTCRSFSGNKLPQLQILAHHHQRLRGVVEDAEQIAVLGARVDVFAIDVER